MNLTDMGRVREQEAILARLHAAGLRPNELKLKHRLSSPLQSHHHTCNHGGGKGRAARRDGWHGNGSSRVTVKGWRAFERGDGPWPRK